MGFFSLLFPWGIVLQALAVVHFIRRRPDTIWLYVIIFLGPIGALAYMGMEVVPDFGLLRHWFDAFGRRTRIKHLEALVTENPSPGNYEELGDLLLEEGKYARARECYDKVLAAAPIFRIPLYRRGIAALQLGDYAAAVRDLEEVTTRESRYDSHRAMALLAHAYANAGAADKAAVLFEQATDASTLTETLLPLRQLSRVAEPHTPKRVTGPSTSSPARRRCRGTCSGASAHGSARQRRC